MTCQWGQPARHSRQGLPRVLPRTRKRLWKPDGPAWDRTTSGHRLASKQRLGSIFEYCVLAIANNSIFILPAVRLSIGHQGVIYQVSISRWYCDGKQCQAGLFNIIGYDIFQLTRVSQRWRHNTDICLHWCVVHNAHLTRLSKRCIWNRHVLQLISPWTKWPPPRGRPIQLHFREWKLMNFDSNFTEICS